MKFKRIILAGFLLVAILAIGTVSASQDFSQNDTAVSDDVLAQDSGNISQPIEAENDESIQSAQSHDEEILQAACKQDNLSAIIVENQSEAEILGKTPGYLAESNIWFQSFDLNEEDSNMWIINDNGKAFPKGSFIKIVVKEKGSRYKAQHTMPIEEIFPERGMENIHYYVLLREFTDIQFKPQKTYNVKVYFRSASGKPHLIDKKTGKIKWSKKKEVGYDVNGIYYFYRYAKNNPYGEFFHQVFKTHPNDKQKIKVIIYNKNGKFYKNKKVSYTINNRNLIYAKTNSRGLLIIDTPKKPGTYRYDVYVSKGSMGFKVKVYHSVAIPKVTLKKSAKKTAIPLQLRKIDGKFYKNQKITFKLDNKTYNLKTNKKGIAKVIIKKSALKNYNVGQTVKLQAIYKNDVATIHVKIKK